MKIFSLMAACGIAVAIPHTALALTDDGRAAYTLLLMGPKENPVKSCASAALQLNTGLTAKLVAKSSDDNVEKDLMLNTTTESFRAERVREAELWKKTHSPGKVAQMNFEYCAQQNKVDTRLGAIATTCFSVAGVPALAEALRIVGRPKEYTAEKVVAAYGKQIPVDFVRATVDSVYAHNAEADNYEAHRQVLADCIRDTRRQVSDEEVLKEYERLKAANGDKEYHVMHIMVANKDLADQLVARLNQGEAFGDLAKAHSSDPGSSKKGGDLGWNVPAVYRPAFAAAVTATAPGSYAPAPVHTQFGWHIVKVDAVRALKFPPFEQVKEKLRTSLESKPAPSEQG